MRVIKEGRLPALPPRTVKCKHCEATIEYYPHEAQVSRTGYLDVLVFDCPCCEAEIKEPK